MSVPSNTLISIPARVWLIKLVFSTIKHLVTQQNTLLSHTYFAAANRVAKA